jgi:hypothetical protein
MGERAQGARRQAQPEDALLARCLQDQGLAVSPEQVWDEMPEPRSREAGMTPEQEASSWRGWREQQVEQDDRDVPAREAFSAGVKVATYHMQPKPAVQSLCELAMALGFMALVGWLAWLVLSGLS